MARLFHLRNYSSVAFHYGTITAISAASLVHVARPWAAITGALLGSAATFTSIKLAKKIFENYMVEHPKVHEFSPNLGKTAEELYKASGLQSRDFPIYDFAIDRAKAKKGGLGDTFKDSFKGMLNIPNAAAVNFGKPVILISKPLMKLLNDAEEKAVLAHEFAHVKSYHHYTTFPLKLAQSAALIANGLTLLAAGFSAGWGFIGAIVAGVVTKTFVKKQILTDEPVKKKKSLMDWLEKPDDLPEIHRRKRADKIAAHFGRAATGGVLSYMVPGYLPLWAAVTSLKHGSNILQTNFSRSNEYQADKGAVALGASPLALITSLRKIEALVERSKQHAWGNHEVPKPGQLTAIWNKLNSTHPPTASRVARLADIARTMGYDEQRIQRAVKDPVRIAHADDIPYETIAAIAARFC